MRVSIEADADNPNITIIFSTTGCSQQDEPYCLLWWLSCTLKNRIICCLTKIRSPSRILLSYLIEFNLWNQNFYPVEKAHNFYSIQLYLCRKIFYFSQGISDKQLATLYTNREGYDVRHRNWLVHLGQHYRSPENKNMDFQQHKVRALFQEHIQEGSTVVRWRCPLQLDQL